MKAFSKLFATACISVLFSVAAAAGSEKGGDHKPLYTMTKIVINLNHFPSPEEKAKLEKIAAADASSDAEKTIAKAIHDMQHTVAGADREKLQAIADGDGDENTKKLATVLLGINHKPSDEAVADLKAIKASLK